MRAMLLRRPIWPVAYKTPACRITASNFACERKPRITANCIPPDSRGVHRNTALQMASKKQAVRTDNAPKPAPFYSQGIVVNGMVYVAGHIGQDPQTGKVVEGTVKDRTKQALENLAAVLTAAGSSKENAVKVNIFLTSMDDYPAMNEAYTDFFPDPKPVRTCVCVKELPLGTDVEIECSGYIETS